MQTSTGDCNLNVNVSRSLTRLKSVFTTLVKAFTWKEAAFNINTIVVAGSKEWNEFYIPLFGVYNDDLSCR